MQFSITAAREVLLYNSSVCKVLLADIFETITERYFLHSGEIRKTYFKITSLIARNLKQLRIYLSLLKEFNVEIFELRKIYICGQ